MATRPNAKDYALPPSCISADENAEGGLAKHLEPLCLSLAERVLLYNQEVLYLQGKEILQGLAKLNANGVAAAAVVDGGNAPTADSGPAVAANGGPTPAAGSGAAAAGTPQGRPYAEAFASAANAARALASAFAMKAKATEDKEAQKKAREGVEGSTRKAAKTILAKDKDIFSDAESSVTEGREQATTKAGEKSYAIHKLGTVIERNNTITSRNPGVAVDRNYFGEGQKTLRKIRPFGAARKSAHNNIVPMVRTATVGKTVEKDGANAARIKEKNLNKRVRSPILTSNSEAEERRASKQTENLHRNKKVKVEVKSEPGNGGL